jgi:hypothetical protein
LQGPFTRRDTVLYRVADGSEGSTFTVTGLGASYPEVICMAYTGAAGLESLGGTDRSTTSAALSVTSNGSMEVITFSMDNASASFAAASGWTRNLDGNGTYNMWSAERAASAGTTTGSNFTSAANLGSPLGYGSISFIVTPV